MLKFARIALVFGVLGFASSSFAHEGDKGHCHGKDKDGKETTLEAKDEKDCTDKGGAWVAAKKAKKDKKPEGGGW